MIFIFSVKFSFIICLPKFFSLKALFCISFDYRVYRFEINWIYWLVLGVGFIPYLGSCCYLGFGYFWSICGYLVGLGYLFRRFLRLFWLFISEDETREETKATRTREEEDPN